MDTADVLRVLSDGEVEVLGRMPFSSNATFLVQACLDGQVLQGVYKPVRGERPLWDFPPGLHRREAAAFCLSEWLGWEMVPPTVVRTGPLGEGSVQRFVDADFEQHYFTLYEDPALHPQLRRICAFDLVVNNTDRKSGHCLLASDGRVYAIDNGLCFSVEPKIRTVIWEFGGEDVPDDLRADLARLAGAGAPAGLRALLDDDECDAVVRRAAHLADRGVFPIDTTGRRYPWPLV